ncbi:N-acetylmuramoyl-L-alanine amidase, partial [Clostridium paraputrificum]
MSNYNVIGIDMGHPLKCGAYGLVSETDKNREIGKELIKILENEGKKIVNCTIDTRYSDDLARRVNIANKAKVDLYVSIHLDSFSDPSANGVTVFTTTTSGA